jgi:hypothetical protein
VSYSAKQGSINFNNFILKNQCLYDVYVIYIIKELVLKQCSKCYASWGNVAKLRRITGLPKNMVARERAENKNPGGGGGDTQLNIIISFAKSHFLWSCQIKKIFNTVVLSFFLSFCLTVFLSFCHSVIQSFCLSVFLSFCFSESPGKSVTHSCKSSRKFFRCEATDILGRRWDVRLFLFRLTFCSTRIMFDNKKIGRF